jgi:hypothetical protein
MRSSSRRRSIVVALSLLAALAAGYAGDYFHTDDGCIVETHCPACQRQLSSVLVFTRPLATVPVLERLGAAVPPPTPTPVLAPIHREVSRGPPSV